MIWLVTPVVPVRPNNERFELLYDVSDPSEVAVRVAGVAEMLADNDPPASCTPAHYADARSATSGGRPATGPWSTGTPTPPGQDQLSTDTTPPPSLSHQ